MTADLAKYKEQLTGLDLTDEEIKKTVTVLTGFIENILDTYFDERLILNE